MSAAAETAKKNVEMRTERLALSPLDPSHAPALFELLNDWDVARMLSEVPWPLHYGDVESFLASEHTTTDDFIILADTGPIGVCGVKKPASGEPPRAMPRLGYWIGQRHWRQGYGTEAVGALTGYAFRSHSAERVGAGVFADNPASRRLLEKLGFSAVGRKNAESRSRGGTVETIDMQITRVDWAKAQAARR